MNPLKNLIIAIVLILSISIVAAAQTKELNIPDTDTIGNEAEPEITVCDHNSDGIRNLDDLSYFATCKDSFDANNDGKHDINDITLYAQNAMDDDWCMKAVPECSPDFEVEEELLVCDHNDDGERNLADVRILTQYVDSFDVNNDEKHDLLDVAIYAQNADNNEWCYSVRDQFGYAADDDIKVCDHNDDGKRNILDATILATYKESFDVNNDEKHDLLDVAIYAQNADNNEWCYSVRDQFGYETEEDPVIVLQGSNPQYIELGDTYTELGAEVEHGNDNNLDIDLNNLEISQVGSYEVIYRFDGAESVVRTITVQDTTVPSIAISTTPNNPDEDEEMDINVVVRDESLVDLEVNIYRNDNLKEEFNKNEVDTEARFEYTPNTDGEYTIEVIATDSEGNTVTEEIEVDVDDRNSGSSSRNHQGNVGDISVIYHTEEDGEEIPATENEETDAIEFQTTNTEETEAIVASNLQETTADDTTNSITGAAIGDSELATNIWVGLLILLIIIAALGILYVLVWSKN